MSTSTTAEFDPLTPGLVAGFDGHRPDRQALLDRAASEAALRGLSLTLLTVRRRTEDPASPAAAAIRRGLDEALAAVRLAHPDLAVHAVCLAEDELDQQTGPLRSAAILGLGLGLHGSTGRPPFEPDSTSRLLLDTVNCPVLLLPDSPEAPGAAGKPIRSRPFVLVGVGRDDEDVVLVRAALIEAARRGLDLHVLHTEAPGVDRGDLNQVRNLVRQARADFRSDISITITLTTEPADTALARYAHDAGLLVVGTRPGSLAGLVDDSVSHDLVSRVTDAGCPVLLMPRPDSPHLFPRPPFEPADDRSPALPGRRSHE